MRPSQIAWIVCLFAFALFIGLRLSTRPPQAQTNAVAVSTPAGVKIGGPFVLTDHNGHTVTERSWPGKYLLVYFGFTHCPDICPIGLGRIADALKELPADLRGKIQPLFITVDPARDTAKVMKEYVTLFDQNLIGLTGTDEQVKHVQKLYRVYAQKSGTGDDYMVNHSGFTYLMTPDGEMAAIFAHETTADDMAGQIKGILAVPRAP